jgi:hypothetical protein
VEDLKKADLCVALIIKGEEQSIAEIPAEIQGLPSEFQSILGEPQELPHMRGTAPH